MAHKSPDIFFFSDCCRAFFGFVLTTAMMAGFCYLYLVSKEILTDVDDLFGQMSVEEDVE